MGGESGNISLVDKRVSHSGSGSYHEVTVTPSHNTINNSNTTPKHDCIDIKDGLNIKCIDVSSEANEKCITINPNTPSTTTVTPETEIPEETGCQGVTDLPEFEVTTINGDVPELNVNIDDDGLVYIKDFDEILVTILNYDSSFEYSCLSASTDPSRNWLPDEVINDPNISDIIDCEGHNNGVVVDNKDGTLTWYVGNNLDGYPHTLRIRAKDVNGNKCISDYGVLDVITMERSSTPIISSSYTCKHEIVNGNDIWRGVVKNFNYNENSEYIFGFNGRPDDNGSPLVRIITDETNNMGNIEVKCGCSEAPQQPENEILYVIKRDILKYQSYNSVSENISTPIHIKYLKVSARPVGDENIIYNDTCQKFEPLIRVTLTITLDDDYTYIPSEWNDKLIDVRNYNTHLGGIYKEHSYNYPYQSCFKPTDFSETYQYLKSPAFYLDGYSWADLEADIGTNGSGCQYGWQGWTCSFNIQTKTDSLSSHRINMSGMGMLWVADITTYLDCDDFGGANYYGYTIIDGKIYKMKSQLQLEIRNWLKNNCFYFDDFTYENQKMYCDGEVVT